MSNEAFDLDIKSSEYKQNDRLRNLSRLLYDGRNEQIQELLIKGTYEDRVYFLERQRSLVYENLLRSIIAARVGLLTRSPVQIKSPDPISPYMEDVTKDGTSMQSFIKQVITDADVDGISWVLVDMPNVNGMVDDEGRPLIQTRQDELNAGIRPYFKRISANNVIRWKQNDHDRKLDWVVIKADVLIEDELGYQPKDESRWIVWSRKTVQIYKRNDRASVQDRYKLLTEFENTLSEVPLIPFYGIKDSCNYTGLPFGYLILDHLTKILNVESQKHHGLELILMPKMYIIGEEPPTEVPTSDNAFFLPIGRNGEKPDIGYVEPSGRGIELGNQEIQELIARVIRATLYLSKKPTAQVQSADSLRAESTIMKADLSSSAVNHENSIAECIRLMYKWETSKDLDSNKISVYFNRDFDTRRLSPQEIKELKDMALTQLLSKQTLWQQLVSGEILPESFDSEKEMINLVEEMDVNEKNIGL